MTIEELRKQVEECLQTLENDQREDDYFGGGGYGDESSAFDDGQIAAFKTVLRMIGQEDKSDVQMGWRAPVLGEDPPLDAALERWEEHRRHFSGADQKHPHEDEEEEDSFNPT